MDNFQSQVIGWVSDMLVWINGTNPMVSTLVVLGVCSVGSLVAHVLWWIFQARGLGVSAVFQFWGFRKARRLWGANRYLGAVFSTRDGVLTFSVGDGLRGPDVSPPLYGYMSEPLTELALRYIKLHRLEPLCLDGTALWDFTKLPAPVLLNFHREAMGIAKTCGKRDQGAHGACGGSTQG